jgi:hypothetical protein
VIDEYEKRREVHQATMREASLNERLKKVQEQNDGLQNGIAILSNKSSGILDEQRNNFISLLDDQRRLGSETAKKVDDSTNLLHAGIGKSIGILNWSANEIGRAVNPIKDVTVSFSAKLAMKDPALADYRKRLESGVVERLKKYRLFDEHSVETGFQVNGITLEKKLAHVSISNGSPLLPDPVAERVAYQSLNYVLLNIDVYKIPLNRSELEEHYLRDIRVYDVDGKEIVMHRKPDLTIPIRATLSPQYDWAIPDLKLEYDMMWKDGYAISGTDIPISPASMTRTEEVTSIPDLKGAQVVILLSIPDAELDYIDIKMSGGLTFRIKNNCKRFLGGPSQALQLSRYYVCQFS